MNLMVDRVLEISFHLLLIALLGGSAVSAQTNDPHRLYEEHCAGCHPPHAGEFVQKNLLQADDEVVGRRSGKELRSLLASGHGKLAPGDSHVLVAHLVFVLEGRALYREKCLICHDRGVVLARTKLILSDGMLVGRYTGREIETFLGNHGRLEGVEIPTIVQMLERQLITQTAEWPGTDE